MAGKKNIALFMGIIDNEYSDAIMRGAVKGARECDTNLIVFPMEIINPAYLKNKTNSYRYQYNILSSYMGTDSIDGVILEQGTITSFLDAKGKRDFYKMAGNKPTVLIAECAEGYTSVCMDNSIGLEELIEHLIMDHNYTKIAFLSGPKRNRDAMVRRDVYVDTMKKHDLYIDDSWIIYGEFSEFHMEKILEDLYSAHPDMEALVCANDNMAFGASKFFREKGLEPGKDIFITGFDNLPAGLLAEPALTTVKADPQELSKRAVYELCKDSMSETNINIKTRLVRRKSCGCNNFDCDEDFRSVFGISTNWMEMAKKIMDENDTRHNLEKELGNINRELVFDLETPVERNEAVLSMFRRLKYKSCAIFLYDEFIENKKDSKWINPETVNLVGYYSDINNDNNHVLDKGELKVPTNELFNWGEVRDGNRHEIVIVPLFFGELQIGFLAVETEPDKYVYVYDIASQVSIIYYTIEIMERQERMKNELRNANKAKSHFLANMSHEIRTPINAIIGFNEMIIRENVDDNILEYANDVKSAADALLAIVNDTLDFSKIESGKMELIDVEYDLINLMKGIVGMMSSRAENKGLKLEMILDEKLPHTLEGDSARLQQILINLITNAIKYTPKGMVTISVTGNVVDDNVRLKFSVADTGIGIKKEDINRLFNLFERIEEKRNRSIEGTGLGINIVTGLLQLMNSELKVQSEYGHGSEFSFEINQKIISAESIASDNTKGKENKAKHNKSGFTAPEVRILVVDDNHLNRKVFKSLLKDTQIIVEQAESGLECIEMVKQNKYDLIMLDHMMPQMDGLETFEIIKQENLVDLNTTPVIVLTANAISGAREKYIQDGFSDYLSKPVIPSKLYEMLLKHLNPEKVTIN